MLAISDQISRDDARFEVEFKCQDEMKRFGSRGEKGAPTLRLHLLFYSILNAVKTEMDFGKHEKKNTRKREHLRTKRDLFDSL